MSNPPSAVILRGTEADRLATGLSRAGLRYSGMHGYGQYCPLAKGAEVLGDRWTLLIIREMLFGVQRFNELERFLPRISRSVLAQRLRHLQRVGLVERQAGADGQRSVYQLTEAGRDLRPV